MLTANSNHSHKLKSLKANYKSLAANSNHPQRITNFDPARHLQWTVQGDPWRHCGGLGKEVLMAYPISQSAHKFNLFTNHGGWSAWCELDVVKTFAINKWEDMSLVSWCNAAITKKRNSGLLNNLTAFGEERCKQSERKLDVFGRCIVWS